MTRPNTFFAPEPDERPEPPQPFTFPHGIELLVRQVSAALRDGGEAFADLMQADTAHDHQAAHAAAARLASALACDPKALAKKIAEGLKP
jgi:hypothetical protein